jgi:hypothetical protein
MCKSVPFEILGNIYDISFCSSKVHEILVADCYSSATGSQVYEKGHLKKN